MTVYEGNRTVFKSRTMFTMSSSNYNPKYFQIIWRHLNNQPSIHSPREARQQGGPNEEYMDFPERESRKDLLGKLGAGVEGWGDGN